MAAPGAAQAVANASACPSPRHTAVASGPREVMPTGDVCHGLESPLPSARCRGRTGDEQWGRPGVSEFWILGPRTLIPGAATRAGLPVSSDTARALLPPASAARPFQPLGPFPPLPAGPARPRLSLAQTPKPPPASPATHGPPSRSPEADSHAQHHGCDLNSRSGLPLLKMLYGLSAA